MIYSDKTNLICLGMCFPAFALSFLVLYISSEMDIMLSKKFFVVFFLGLWLLLDVSYLAYREFYGDKKDESNGCKDENSPNIQIFTWENFGILILSILLIAVSIYAFIAVAAIAAFVKIVQRK